MDPSLSALIVGCGYVGSRLRDFLGHRGWHVDSIRRSKKFDRHDLMLDVRNSFTLSRKYDVVFYMVSAASYHPEAYETAYHMGALNTLQALEKSGQNPRFIFVSSTSLFAENSGKVVTEESPIETNIFAKESLWKGESLVRSSGFSHIVLRLSGIYGPNRCRLLDQAKNGGLFLKKSPVISNRIHVDDCVGSLYHLATLKNPKALYIGTDHEPTVYNEVVLWLADILGKDKPRTEENSSKYRHISNKKCSNQRLVDSGYFFQYPSFREGFSSCLSINQIF